ncbi:MAG: molybdopterin-guanine dinucleotide biosynthesis protein B [Rhodospirillaceae bacterium]|nr:molybdopterin-guanine dinucleotide biosynthesis protein B [Rhodospirillaceae bacterium]|tara:strand:+ start:2275 stop:2793 length:519 start_codon:yes stop_codon:yes gene_type:complete
MKTFGFAGWSGSGKTRLIVRLLPELTGRGYSVSTIKHAHHNFDIDKPGKDSFEHRQAGAAEVMIASEKRWALMHEHRGAPEPDATALLAEMTPVDLVLVEGFKAHAHPKLEVYRADIDKPLLHPEDSYIVAIASDKDIETELPCFNIENVPAIADFIENHCGLSRPAMPGVA